MKKILALVILSVFIGQGASMEAPNTSDQIAKNMISEMDRTSQLFPYPKSVHLHVFLGKALEIESSEFLRVQPWIDKLKQNNDSQEQDNVLLAKSFSIASILTSQPLLERTAESLCLLISENINCTTSVEMAKLISIETLCILQRISGVCEKDDACKKQFSDRRDTRIKFLFELQEAYLNNHFFPKTKEWVTKNKT